MSIITDIEPGVLSTVSPEIVAFTTEGSTSTAAAIPTGTTVELLATEDCYYAFGTSAPTAASTTHYLPAKTIKRLRMHGALFIAARGVSNSGSLYVSKVILAGEMA
jgi:hypothetical protein